MTTVGAILAASILAMLTDRLFLRLLFKEAASQYPEIWWPGVRDGDTKTAAIWSAGLGFVMTAGVVVICLVAGDPGFFRGVFIGLMAFIAGPFAVLLINFQFVKSDVWLLVSQNLAYLARMLIAGAVAGLMLPLA